MTRSKRIVIRAAKAVFPLLLAALLFASVAAAEEVAGTPVATPPAVEEVTSTVATTVAAAPEVAPAGGEEEAAPAPTPEPSTPPPAPVPAAATPVEEAVADIAPVEEASAVHPEETSTVGAVTEAASGEVRAAGREVAGATGGGGPTKPVGEAVETVTEASTATGESIAKQGGAVEGTVDSATRDLPVVAAATKPVEEAVKRVAATPSNEVLGPPAATSSPTPPDPTSGAQLEAAPALTSVTPAGPTAALPVESAAPSLTLPAVDRDSWVPPTPPAPQSGVAAKEAASAEGAAPFASAMASPPAGPLTFTPAANAPPTGAASSHGQAPHGPVPLAPGAPLPGAATGGSSGPVSFVPMLGLAVLVALTAPALLRRTRELAEQRSVTPFVCALERPG